MSHAARKTPKPAGIRLLAFPLLLLALLAMVLGPRAQMRLCVTGCCPTAVADAAAPDDCCASSCCAEGSEAADETERDDDGRSPSHRRGCPPRCCVVIALELEPGPMPRGVDKDPPPAEVAATATAAFELPPAHPTLPLVHATGPPRVDHRTALLSSTVLRL